MTATLFSEGVLEAPRAKGIDFVLNFFSREETIRFFEKMIGCKNFFQQNHNINLEDEPTNMATSVYKKNFLVCKHKKYISVPTEKIAFFYVQYESTIMVCFDKQEYFVNYSLGQIQHLIGDKTFFRLNRKYLVNFNAVKEVEHYFSRKLLVNLIIPARDKLLASKEKVRIFLQWLDNR